MLPRGGKIARPITAGAGRVGKSANFVSDALYVSVRGLDG